LKRLKKQIKIRSDDDRITALLNSLPGNATLLDWDLRITNQSTTARRLTAQWMGRVHESLPRAFELPAEILAVCSEMKREWRTALQEDSQSRLMTRRVVAHPQKAELRAEISLVQQQDSVLAHPGFLIHLWESPTEKLLAGSQLDLAILTPAEREAVLLAAEGLINIEIAERLGISVAAVKLRLHGAFKKLHVRNRTELAAILR
jgi:DNA-binding CsgD family transcriptional regulator